MKRRNFLTLGKGWNWMTTLSSRQISPPLANRQETGCTHCWGKFPFFACHKHVERLRWSKGSLLAFSTQIRGFKPGRRIFKGEKIHITPSFGGEVKPSVPCRRFAAYKRILNGVEVVISAKLPDNILAHSSHFRRWDLSRRGGRGATWWWKVRTSKKRGKAVASYP